MPIETAPQMDHCAWERGCDRPIRTRGFCRVHYVTMMKRGRLKKRTDWERFWEKVDVVPGMCWTWTASVSNHGYAYFSHPGGRQQVAHRHAWELLVGPIPDGLQLDHLCRNRRCVNPDHLEPVTAAENLRRSPTATTLNARKKVCIRGHDDWAIRPTGGRLCRTCQREYAARRDRQREYAAARDRRKVAS